MPAARLHSVDLLRGLVIVLMALDHTRDYFSDRSTGFAIDPDQTNAALFFTRWISHFCAPVFVLLAGVGAALAEQRGMTKAQLAKFLFVRGLWLVVLEFTAVHLGFYFNLDYSIVPLLVIWALGVSMMFLAALQFLPRILLLAFSLLLILGHNAMDGVSPAAFGSFDWLWVFLHAPGSVPLGPVTLFPPYKIVPWAAVMSLGYCLGPVFRCPAIRRRTFFLLLGVLVTAAFIALRERNQYGDPAPWLPHPGSVERRLFAFLNCEKYPPSLCYLLMTLGPAFLALALFDREPGWLGRRLLVFGRVPLFFYLLHLPLIHGLAVLVSFVHHGAVAPWLVAPPERASAPPDYGYPLGIVYLAWIVVVVLLYPLCDWFGAYKKRRPGGWRSYL